MFQQSVNRQLGVSDLCLSVLQGLRRIEEEAQPVERDYPTGLWWYCGHLDRNGVARPKNNTEVCWSTRLAEYWRGEGLSCETEIAYPKGPRSRCDIVVDYGANKPAWVEIKGAWRAKFDPPGPNSAYQKHLVAAAKDVDKLGRLSSEDASALVVVLVGFDQAEMSITEKHLSGLRARTTSADWMEFYASWQVQMRVSFRVRCWVWGRRVESK